MRLSDIKKLVEAAGVPCFKWVVPDPEDIPIPHACVAKIANGENLYADNGNYFPTAKCQMYVAMYDDDRQDGITELYLSPKAGEQNGKTAGKQ